MVAILGACEPAEIFGDYDITDILHELSERVHLVVH